MNYETVNLAEFEQIMAMIIATEQFEIERDSALVDVFDKITGWRLMRAVKTLNGWIAHCADGFLLRLVLIYASNKK